MFQIYADNALLYDPRLTDEGYTVIDPILTMEVNHAGSLTFTLPPEGANIRGSSIRKLKTTIYVLQDGKEVWRGRVLHDDTDFYGRKEIYCEGELSFLMDTLQAPYEHTGSVKDLFDRFMAEHKAQQIGHEDRMLACGRCTVTDKDDNGVFVRSNSDYNQTLSEIVDKLVDPLGGYLKIENADEDNDPYLVMVNGRYEDKTEAQAVENEIEAHDVQAITVAGNPILKGGTRVLSFLTEEDYFQDSDQVIDFGVNLLDFEQNINAEDVFTVLIPLGAKLEKEQSTQEESTEESTEVSSETSSDTATSSTESRVTIFGATYTDENGNEQICDKNYIENDEAIDLFGRIVRVYKWDDVTLPDNLYRKGEELLSQNIAMAVTLSIKAVDLYFTDQSKPVIKLGDRVRVRSLPHGLDAKFNCTKVVIDMQHPDQTEYTFGIGFRAMTEQQVESQKKAINAAAVTASETVNASVSQVNIEVAGNYVSKSAFEEYQSKVNQNDQALQQQLADRYTKSEIDAKCNAYAKQSDLAQFTQRFDQLEQNFNDLREIVEGIQ